MFAKEVVFHFEKGMYVAEISGGHVKVKDENNDIVFFRHPASRNCGDKKHKNILKAINNLTNAVEDAIG